MFAIGRTSAPFVFATFFTQRNARIATWLAFIGFAHFTTPLKFGGLIGLLKGFFIGINLIRRPHVCAHQKTQNNQNVFHTGIGLFTTFLLQ